MPKKPKLRQERYAARRPVWLDPLQMDRAASILIVEDDEDILKLLRFFVVSVGACVDCLSDGSSVIDYMASGKRPDLILLDRMLPGLSGDKLLDCFQADESWSTIPVLVVSAISDTHEVAGMLASGASGYITKPFVPVELARQINHQLILTAPQKAMFS
ncbi:MAG: PleD family two-component system response regulator [Burkholderiaceae bacterium]